jgi:hypothetical protein
LLTLIYWKVAPLPLVHLRFQSSDGATLAIECADLAAEQEGFNPATQCQNEIVDESGTYWDHLSCMGDNPGGGLP